MRNLRAIILAVILSPYIIYCLWREALDEEIKEMYESRGIYLGH